MFKKSPNNSAFSLLEILLASIIFIISVGGIFVTLNAIRRPVTDKETALSAAVFGKQVLEALRSQVDANTYYSGCSTDADPCPDFSLSLGAHSVTNLASTGLSSWPQGLASNAINYWVSCSDDNSDTTSCSSTGGSPDMARRVDLNLQWNDAP